MKRKLLVLFTICLVFSSNLSLPAVSAKTLTLAGYFGYRAYKELKANWKNIKGEEKLPLVENEHQQNFTSNPSFKGSLKESDRLYNEAMYWDKEEKDALASATYYNKIGRYDTARIYLNDAKDYARKADKFRSDATFEKSHGN